MRGTAHRVFTGVLSFPAGYMVSQRYPGRIDLAFGVFLGCMAGMVITPDLDQSEARRGFNYWSLYGRLIPHRSFWSHCPVIGTAIRCAYLLWAPAFVIRYWHLPWEFAKEFLIAAFIGLCVADFGHWFLDLFPSGDKQYD